MTDTETNKLTLLDWHKPGIEAGEYTIQVTQKIVAEGIPENDPGFATESLSFAVRCEQFVLAPKEVYAVFPPDGSMGDHSLVLPHVVLTRSTLPWERRTDDKDRLTPWLALLVFHAGEIGEAKSMRLDEAVSGQSVKDQVTVIEVKKELLKSIVPSASELRKLTHVRRREIVPSASEPGKLTDVRKCDKAEVAVVISQRLPKPNGFSTAHLVSLEHRFTESEFNFVGAKDGEKIRLISLASFRFGCFEPNQRFSKLLRALNKPAPGANHDESRSLRLPDSLIATSAEDSVKTIAHDHLASGSVPLRYRMRSGQTAVSWYHGPLAPGRNSLPNEPLAPVQVADELVRYSSRTGMFDVSYAAAWEMGRLLALQDKNFSIGLQRWKQEHAKLGQLAKPEHEHPLAQLNASTQDLPLPEPLRIWLDQLSLLEGVPFSYLVPDERMLPLESIRFFALDCFWIECLLDGAFSIGRHTGSDKSRDAKHKKSGHISLPHPSVTGVILRSEAVSGWPGLQVDGKNDKPLKILRLTRLSRNILFCLFEGEISGVTFHPPIETLHFGVEQGENGEFFKQLGNGQVAIGLKSPTDMRILAVNDFLKSGSADFAEKMIEQVEEVTFSISKPAYNPSTDRSIREHKW
jgi:hypothetical protein